MARPGLVVGGSLFADSSETKSDNRLSQWGAGLEILSDFVDFRANFYDASSSRKKSGEFRTSETRTTTRTSTRTTAASTAKSTGSVTTQATTTTTTTGTPTVSRTQTGSSQTVVDTQTTTVNLSPKIEVLSGGGSGAPSAPYAQEHEIRYDQPGGSTVKYTPVTRTDTTTTIRYTDTYATETVTPYTTRHDTTYTTTDKTTWTTTSRAAYRTETARVTTNRLFERFESGMDGWDAELGFRLPWKGPETRVFGGYYDYDNPYGEDVDGWKARLEVKPGPWLSLDGELYENGRLHGSDWFVGLRAQIPLSRDLSWQDFREGLFSLRPRCLDERMRGEMARREGVIAAQSPWSENVAKREVERRVEVDERVVVNTSSRDEIRVSTRTESREETGTTTTQDTETESRDVASTVQGPEVEGTPYTVTGGGTVTLAKNITFVDGAYDEMAGAADGRAATPYNNLQKAADNAGANTTIFVYEPGGRNVREGGKVYVKAGNGDKYDQTVELKPGQTLTSTVAFTEASHPGGETRYQTQNLPLIEPTRAVDATVQLRENTTLERMAVTAHGADSKAVALAPTESSTASDHVVIKDSALKALDADGDAVFAEVRAGRVMGDLTLENVTAEADDYAVLTRLRDGRPSNQDDGAMGNLSINKGAFSGNKGVHTDGEMYSIASGSGVWLYHTGTMGNLSISEAAIEARSGNGVDIRAANMGDFTITGGSIKADGNGVYTRLSGGPMGKLTVSDTTIEAGSDGVYIDAPNITGNPAITGGSIKAGDGRLGVGMYFSGARSEDLVITLDNIVAGGVSFSTGNVAEHGNVAIAIGSDINTSGTGVSIGAGANIGNINLDLGGHDINAGGTGIAISAGNSYNVFNPRYAGDITINLDGGKITASGGDGVNVGGRSGIGKLTIQGGEINASGMGIDATLGTTGGLSVTNNTINAGSTGIKTRIVENWGGGDFAISGGSIKAGAHGVEISVAGAARIGNYSIEDITIEADQNGIDHFVGGYGQMGNLSIHNATIKAGYQGFSPFTSYGGKMGRVTITDSDITEWLRQ